MQIRRYSHIKLWSHQRNALLLVERYLKSDCSGSALIRMPTGTGKSGIMAVVAQFSAGSSVLIVVPWVTLRSQLLHEIQSEFWKKIGFSKVSLKKVVKFTPSNAKDVLRDSGKEPTIFICNIQTLENIHRSQTEVYDMLRSKIDLIMFDEGHREPAPQWARAIRDLSKPCILLTATPYRNDHKIFQISEDFVFALPYGTALSDRYVRQVEFRLEDWKSAQEFVDRIRNFYHKELQRLRLVTKQPRMIVRCETRAEVTEITGLLRKAGESAIAIHESYKKSDDVYRRTVPTPFETSAIFWVHQNKLIEGVDNPSFCFLAIYKPFRNARSLVQQIGRITRNPGRSKGQTAIVIAKDEHGQREFWEKYISYEEYFRKNVDLYKTESVYDLSMRIQDMYVYFEGDFRKRFDIDSPDIHKHFRYRLSANCFRLKGDLSMETLRKHLEDEYAKADLQIRNVVQPDADTIVFPYIKYENSYVLLDESYIEVRLGYAICKKINHYLFFYDSNGRSCEFLSKNEELVQPQAMQSLFRGKNAKLTELTLLNSDLGKHSIRRRTIDAYSISETAPALSDFAYLPSTSRGFTSIAGRSVRRYVGFSRGKVSDASRDEVHYDDYMDWLKLLSTRLQEEGRPFHVFDRFASFADPPTNVTPTGILLDVSSFADFFETSTNGSGRRQVLEIEDAFYKVVDNSFVLETKTGSFPVKINYNSESKRFTLESPSLELSYVRKMSIHDEIDDNIIQFLNNEQPFRISVNASYVIYANSHFYKTRLLADGRSNSTLDLLEVLIPIQELASVKDEKGIPDGDGKGWQQGSLFSMIDSFGKGTTFSKYFGSLNGLVCDDLLNEIADFIAINESEGRVIFIHAKATKANHPVSASKLQEVCAQAVKNLSYLHPMGSKNPPNLLRWAGTWNDKGRIVKNRMRLGNKDPVDFWKSVCEIVRNPLATREVWIVLGSGLSKSHLQQERNGHKPSPEVIQILYLLSTTWHAISETGAKLKIFCSP